MNSTVPTLCRATLRRGFTLIELLVVIAVTAVLFALLLVPLVSALRYTQQAQIVTAAQDAARITKERLTRELNSAAFVFDGTSHPFKVVPPATTTAGDDRYTNFLDLQILDKSGNPVVAHAYSAKLDFVLPKLNTGDAVDPTTGEPIKYRPSNGSSVIGNPSYIFPLAAGTTMIRYFIALKDPTKPYNNTREGKSNSGDDNTYILYRAQFQPYVKSGTGVKANPELFATRDKVDAAGVPVLDASGQKIEIPELDDPDFFRYVNIKADGTAGPATDVNWLDDAHGLYPAQTPVTSITATAPDGSMPHDYPDGSPEQHNYRVENWKKIAKPVIPGPNVDLLLLPHNTDNTLAYDSATGAFPGVAHSGVAHDPVPARGKNYPIVNTSVTFRPATVSGDATPGTTSDYTSQGVTTTDQAGFTYIPTVYTATSQSWSLPFHVSLYQSNYSTLPAASQMYYDTAASPSTVTVDAANGLYTHAGDILEYRHGATDPAGTGTLVYNVTQDFAYPIVGAAPKQYVPMSINPDTGTINFAAPSLPKGPSDRFTRQWPYGAFIDTPANPATAAARRTGGVDTNGLLDLTKPIGTSAPLADSPLAGTDPTNNNAPTGITNAHIAPGSIRIYGPDTRPGASNGNLVSYTEVNLNSASSVGIVGEDQFSVDYLNSTIQLPADLYALLVANPAASVNVVYDYQANMTLDDPSQAYSYSVTGKADNVYQPMQVKVDYQTRDLIDVTLGVRIYDITNNRAQVIPTETKIKIGNSNR